MFGYNAWTVRFVVYGPKTSANDRDQRQALEPREDAAERYCVSLRTVYRWLWFARERGSNR